MNLQHSRPKIILVLVLAIGGMSALALWRFTRPPALPSLADPPASGFRFFYSDSCFSDRQPDPQVKLTRNNNFLRAEAFPVMNCSYRPTAPQVLFTPKRVTLAIEESPSVDGYAAACVCAKHLTYDLYQPVTAGTTIVLQQEGEDVAHGSAP